MKRSPGAKPARDPLLPLVENATLTVASLLKAACSSWLSPAGEPYPDGGWHIIRGCTISFFFWELSLARHGAHARVEDAFPEIAQVADEARAIIRELPCAELTPEHFGHVHETLVGYGVEGGDLVRTDGRSAFGAHFTPPELADKVMRTTLEPMVRRIQDEPKWPRSLLSLRVCDPAVGAGAFLLALVRYLGGLVFEHREAFGGQGPNALQAKQLVARHCAHGVDKDPYGVYTAKLALALECGQHFDPAVCGNANLHHGDALLGLTLDQIRAFHWLPTEERCCSADQCVDAMVSARIRLAAGPYVQGPGIPLQQLPLHAESYATAREDVMLVADVCLGAFFAYEGTREREAERARRRDLVERWGVRGADFAEIEAELREMQRCFRATQVPFYWDIVFLDSVGHERKQQSFANAFIGNPPFLGGGKVSSLYGNAYRDWLQTVHEQSAGRADLSAHFFRRAHALLGECGGFIGFISTSSIRHGDTRLTGLQYLVEHGMTIYNATSSMEWPGAANVTVSIVHLAQ